MWPFSYFNKKKKPVNSYLSKTNYNEDKRRDDNAYYPTFMDWGDSGGFSGSDSGCSDSGSCGGD